MAMAKKRDEEEEERVMGDHHGHGGIVQVLPVFAKELIAGGVAGGLAKTAVAPLERVKILFQIFNSNGNNGKHRSCPTRSHFNAYLKEHLSNWLRLDQTRRAEYQSVGLLGSFTKIARTEGILGFYRGNGASVFRIVPYAALHYMTYEQYRRWIIIGFPDIGRGPVLDLLAGSLSGGTAVLVTYPLDLVRTKLAYQVVASPKLKIQSLPYPDHVYKGISDCFSRIFRESGIRGLYRGVAPSLYGIFPYAGLKFFFYEEMKTYVPEEHKNDIMAKLFCGSVAGLLGQTFTYPLDVVRRQMQVQRLSASNNGELKGTMHSLVMIVQKQGWKQLFSGLSINYLKVVPSVAIGFTVYDIMKLWLRVPSRDYDVSKAVAEEGGKTRPSSLHS